MKKLSLSLLVSLLVVTSGAADYQQLPGHFGGFGSDGDVITVADDFEFGQQTLLVGLNWWGGYFNPPPGPDNFTVRLFSDRGGHPEYLLDQFDFGAVAKLATGQYVNPGLYPEFKYSASFPTPFLAEAGVKYWVSIVNPPRDIWLWEASASSLNPGVQRSFAGGSWEPYYDNTAFQTVTVAVPEPSASMIIAVSLGSIWLFAWSGKSAGANRRLAGQPNGAGESGRDCCGRRAFPAAVADPCQ